MPRLVPIDRVINERRQLLSTPASEIKNKTQFWHNSQQHTFGQQRPQKSGRTIQNLGSFTTLISRLGPDQVNEHLGTGEIAGNLYGSNIDQPQTRVPDFVANQLCQLALQRICDSVIAGKFSRHIGLASAQSELARDFPDLVHLNLIAGFDIVIIFHPDTTLNTVAHFVDVILETSQRFQLTLINDDIVA